MSAKCKVQIYLPDGNKATIINAMPDNTLREILYNIDFQADYDYVLFTGQPGDKYGTPLVNRDSTLTDINMWFNDVTYVAEITIYRADSDYNKELYALYTSRE